MKRNIFVEIVAVGVLFVAVFAANAADSSPEAERSDQDVAGHAERSDHDVVVDEGEDEADSSRFVDEGRFTFPGVSPTIAGVAEALEMDPFAVSEALRQGHTLAELIEEAGADRDAVSEALVHGFDELIEDAADQGRITSRQADALRDHVEANVDAYIDLPLGVLDGALLGVGLHGIFTPRGDLPEGFEFEFFTPFDAPFFGDRFHPGVPEELRQRLEELRDQLNQLGEGEFFPFDGELPELPEELRDLLEGHELREFFRYLDPESFEFDIPDSA